MALDLPAHVDFSKQLMEPDVYVSTHNTVSGIFDSKDLAVDPSDIEVVPRWWGLPSAMISILCNIQG